MMRKGVFWVILFVAIAAAAVVYLMYFADDSRSFLGLPFWIFPFMLLHLGFTASVWAFTKWYWTEEKEEEG